MSIKLLIQKTKSWASCKKERENVYADGELAFIRQEEQAY